LSSDSLSTPPPSPVPQPYAFPMGGSSKQEPT